MMMPNEMADSIKHNFEKTTEELSKIIVGQNPLFKNLFVCMLCGGHVLLEGVPGLGKTMIVRAISEILSLKFSRIQFTPDLMPADIIGTNIVNTDEKGKRYFEFYKGPIFGQIILADEINRASPKTQSALLEAMQEESVTVFGETYRLDPPFIVLATQNPLEMEGTYPLPEAQIDRFFFKLLITYPERKELGEIVDKTTEEHQFKLSQVLDTEAILNMKQQIKQVPIVSAVRDYAVRLVLASHPDSEFSIEKTRKYVRYGASPRGAQSIVMASKVYALLDGRYNVAFSDIREAAKPSLRHRIILNLKGEAEGIGGDEIIEDILRDVKEKISSKK